MAKIYTKDTWTDEVLSGAETYEVVKAAGGAITNVSELGDVAINLTTSVAVAGTPVDAAKMNRIETGIDGLDTLLNDLLFNAKTLAGVKTFSSSPVVPTPTTDMQSATKKYVDDTLVTIPYPPMFRYGCVLSNNVSDAANDIDITAGYWRDSTNAANLNGTAMTKRLDADWAAGTNQGMRYKGAAIANGTYHIYLVSKAAGADPDYYADPNATIATVITHLQAETGGSAYIYARRIGSITRVSNAISLFDQNDKKFTLRTPILDVDNTNLTTASQTFTLTSIPTGIITEAIIWGVAYITGTSVNVYIRSLTQTDIALSAVKDANIRDSSAGNGNGTVLFIITNTSSQIAARASAAVTGFTITTHGWIDTYL